MSKIYNLDIIPSILENFKIKNIVLSGVKDENLIKNILSYDANYKLINTPEINFNVTNGNPLEVLNNLSNYDAIFIDDDSNWYTIFKELNIIKNTNDEFPLVFICNNKFPNKRRDSYSNPDIIPKEFRKDFLKELPICHNNEKISIFDGFYHACEENTPQNGVLTGIEDFLHENSYVGIMKINFIDGLTILYNKLPINSKRIDIIYKDIEGMELNDLDLSSKLIENKLLVSYINKYNVFNEKLSDYELEISNKNGLINDYKDKIRIQDNEIHYKNSKIDSFESKLNLKDTKIKSFESKLNLKDTKIKSFEFELANKNKTIDNLQNELQDNNNKFESKLADKDKKIDNLQNELQNNNNQINSLKNDFLIRDKEHENQLLEANSKIDNQEKIIRQQKNRLEVINQKHTYQLSKMDIDKYCINCFKEEVKNNHAEIDYLKNNTLIKKILSPFSYLYLILKSNPKEVSLNIKLLKALKNSNCFDIGFYLNNNPDIQKSIWCKYFSPELHYVCNGFNEERKFNKKYFNRNSKKDLLNYIKTCNK